LKVMSVNVRTCSLQ